MVDDSRFVRGYVADLLTTAGYEVGEAEDGKAALRRLERESYDVIVTDLNMPALDGFAVLETVKLRDLGSEVVILTGSHAKDIDAAVRALRLGAHDYLTKPLTAPDQALLAVERALGTKRQREALIAAERRYRTLFDGIPVGLYRSTPDGTILEANLTLVQMLGFPSREALLSVNARDLYADPSERERWVARLTQAGTLERFEVSLRRQDGSTVSVHEYCRVVAGEAAGASRYEGCIVDISQRATSTAAGPADAREP